MKKTVVLDDLTGEEASTSVTFGLNDKMYEIDLSDENAEELIGTLNKYVKVAREKLMQDQSVRTNNRVSTEEKFGAHPSSREIRKWARRNGYSVKGRGRIPQRVILAWEDEQEGNGSSRRRNDQAA